MLPFITDTNRKYKRQEKNKHCGSRGESGSREMCCTHAACVAICMLVLQRQPELCQRPACCIQQRCGRRSGGDRILGRTFFLLPREQTMVSWNNAADQTLSKENKALTSWVLKAQSWANTLSCYNQASVNFHCRLKLRTRENLFGWGTLFLFFFDLTANRAQGARFGLFLLHLALAHYDNKMWHKAVC